MFLKVYARLKIEDLWLTWQTCSGDVTYALQGIDVADGPQQLLELIAFHQGQKQL